MKRAFALAVLLLASGCAGRGRARQPSADRAVREALRQIGSPYKFGGETPAGFDCSGLVRYSFGKAGLVLPRGTDGLFGASHEIKLAEAQPGDLLFFDQEGKKNSHVALYLGSRQFVHAPSTGGKVRRDRLDGVYWEKHLSSVRRL